MAEDVNLRLRRMQHTCWRALNLYTDLAEATCTLLTNAKRGPIGARDRVVLAQLRRQENAAQAAYMKIRAQLMTELNIIPRETSAPGEEVGCQEAGPEETLKRAAQREGLFPARGTHSTGPSAH